MKPFNCLKEPIDAQRCNIVVAEQYGHSTTFETHAKDKTSIKPLMNSKLHPSGSPSRRVLMPTLSQPEAIKVSHWHTSIMKMRNQTNKTEHQRLITNTPSQGLEFEEDYGNVLKFFTVQDP
jgi:hypothetical protein